MSILNLLKTINWKAFDGPIELPGLVDCELPDLEALSETVSGAGINGEVDMPTLGHYGPLKLKLNFRQLSKEMLALSMPIAHPIELRGATQVYNAALGVSQVEPVKIVTRSIPKTSPLGKLATNAATESSVEFEVVYIKVFVGGLPMFELDKFNGILIVGAYPVMAQVAAALGGL